MSIPTTALAERTDPNSASHSALDAVRREAHIGGVFFREEAVSSSRRTSRWAGGVPLQLIPPLRDLLSSARSPPMGTSVPAARSSHPEPVRNLIRRDLAQQADVAEHRAGTEDDGREGILGHEHRQTDVVAQPVIEIAQQRAAAGEHDAAIIDVGAELGRNALERLPHCLDNL